MNIWALPPLISSIISIFILLYIFNLDLKSKFNRIFFLVVIVSFIWSFSEFNYRVTNDYQVALVCTNIAKIWIFILPLTFDLILTFVDKKIKNKILYYILLYLPIVSLYVIDMMNLVMSDLVKSYWGYSYIKPANPYFNAIYLILVTVICLLNGFLSLYYALKRKRIKDFIFLFAIFLPIIVGILTDVILPIFLKILVPGLTTACFTITFILIAIIIKKYNLFMPDLKKSIETILLTMSDALFILDTDFKIKIVNKSASDFLEYREEEMLNKTILLFISEKSLTHFIRMIKFAMQHDYIIKDEEALFLSKNEEEIPVSFSCSVIKDNNKQIIGLLLIVRDITSRKKLEEILEITNESFVNIIEKSIEGIIIVDKSLSINYMNPIAKRYLNMLEGEILYRFPYDNISSYSIEEIEINIGNNEKGIGELITIPTKWKKNDAFLIIIRDITTRKEIEKKLISSLKLKENLLAEIHHRIKNNLQIVMTLLRLPLRFSDNPILKSILLDAQFRIKTMALIHEKLYKDENFFEINFKDYIIELTDFLLSFFQMQKDIKVELSIDDVNFDSDTSISCGLIITELFTNSIKYAFNNKEDEKIITITLKKENNNFTLIYKDNGSGLPEGISLENINTTGLYLIKLLAIEKLKGMLEIKSENGLEYNIYFSITDDYI